jgi:hypothetical protein
MHASFETVVALEMRDAIPNVSDIRISLILHNRDSSSGATSSSGLPSRAGSNHAAVPNRGERFTVVAASRPISLEKRTLLDP